MSHFISIRKDDDAGGYVHVKVNNDLYLYIMQLEGAIKYPDKTKIREMYPGRFDKDPPYEPMPPKKYRDNFGTDKNFTERAKKHREGL